MTKSTKTEPSFLPADTPMLDFEKEASSAGYSFVAGVDEAGRGCCAGPVVAAAVVFTDRSRIPEGINDSKKLTPKKRMELRELLMNDPTILYAIGQVHAEEIDSINILQATWKAMRLALEGISEADFALIDGNPVKGLHLPSRSIVKGDAKSASIAAASILAKTTRDLWIEAAAEQYPDYAFEVHKGYCTPLHTERITLHGPCPIHRKTFEPVKSILNPPDLIQDDLFG